MEQNAELRLPTIAVPVRLALVGGGIVDAEFFLTGSHRGGRGQLLEALAEMLDEDFAFVPVREPTGVRLLAKRSIAWACASRRADDGEEIGESPADVVTLYDRQHRVEIELVGGQRFSGSLFDSSPHDRPRVIDHLNRARRFVRLWTANDQTLISTEQIVAVIDRGDGSREET
jgi:hypothetical protein